jgi:hypothetical protein
VCDSLNSAEVCGKDLPETVGPDSLERIPESLATVQSSRQPVYGDERWNYSRARASGEGVTKQRRLSTAIVPFANI